MPLDEGTTGSGGCLRVVALVGLVGPSPHLFVVAVQLMPQRPPIAAKAGMDSSPAVELRRAAQRPHVSAIRHRGPRQSPHRQDRGQTYARMRWQPGPSTLRRRRRVLQERVYGPPTVGVDPAGCRSGTSS